MSNGEILSAFGEIVSNPVFPEVAISCVYGVIDSRHEIFSAAGETVDSDIVAAGDSKIIDLTKFDVGLMPRETLTVAVQTISGTATSTDGAVAWSEDK